MVSYDEYKNSSQVMKEYEIIMCKLGFTKSPALEEIVKTL